MVFGRGAEPRAAERPEVPKTLPQSRRETPQPDQTVGKHRERRISTSSSSSEEAGKTALAEAVRSTPGPHSYKTDVPGSFYQPKHPSMASPDANLSNRSPNPDLEEGGEVSKRALTGKGEKGFTLHPQGLCLREEFRLGEEPPTFELIRGGIRRIRPGSGDIRIGRGDGAITDSPSPPLQQSAPPRLGQSLQVFTEADIVLDEITAAEIKAAERASRRCLRQRPAIPNSTGPQPELRDWQKGVPGTRG
mmetsp:Transcript_32836/g.76479  ORF Transcript_32836/g.76479 Transcript_32836/m.76479 type:complete len:248 (-) Transcript_32836:145-888(-)